MATVRKCSCLDSVVKIRSVDRRNEVCFNSIRASAHKADKKVLFPIKINNLFYCMKESYT